MLNEKHIPIGKLKQAYELSGHDVDVLMAFLLPDKVFPYALWHTAYENFWCWAIRTAAQQYNIEEPQFPDAGPLPEKYFPTFLHTTLLVRFFADTSKTIAIKHLEAGFDYIIESTYGDDFPFKEQKESLFHALRQEERSFENWQRTSGPLKIESFQAVDYFCISESFPDTILVDKAAAVCHLHDCGYSLYHEVKGLSQAAVMRLTAPPAFCPAEDASMPSAVDTSHMPDTPLTGVHVSRSLWEGKTHTAVRDGMRNQDFDDCVIAYVLYEWCKLKNKTQIGRLLSNTEMDDSSCLRLTNRFLEEAASLDITDA